MTDVAINYAKNILRKEAQMELSVGATHLTILKLSIFMDEVKLSPLPSTKTPVQDISVTQIQVRLDPLELLFGQIKIAAIILDGMNLQIDIDAFPKDNLGPQKLPLTEIFQWAEKIPVTRLGLRKSRLTVVSKKMSLKADIFPMEAMLSNNLQKLSLRLYSPSATIQSQRLAEPASISIESMINLEPNKISLQSQFMALGQTLQLSGSVKNPIQLLISPEGDLKAKFSSDLKPLGEKLKSLLTSSVPILEGRLQLETSMSFKGLKKYSGYMDLKTKNIKIESFELGDLETRAHLEETELKLEEIKILHPSGQATLKKNIINLSSPFVFKSHVIVSSLDLQRLLQSLKLYKVPVWMMAQAELPCEGQLINFELNCKGEMKVQDLIVKTGIALSEKTIVEVPQGIATGSLHVDLEKVTLKTQVQFGDGQGPVDGEVYYKKGFDFRFKTDSLDFKNIKQLSGLDFKGSVALDGFTRGDSNGAVLNLKTDIKDFVFEKYKLGRLQGLVRYAKSHLFIEQINGQLPQSNYNGQIDIDLKDQSLSGSVQLPKTDLGDIADIFQNIYIPPVKVQGVGSANLDFSGPFNFWKLNYNLVSQFKNGKIEGETFSKFIFNVESRQGQITAKQVELSKGISLARMTGTIENDQTARLAFEGSNLRLEESEIANKIKNNLVGAFNFSGAISGPIMNPDLTLKGHIAELMADEQELPSSFFQLKMNRELFQADANLFGNKIQGDLKIPWGDSRQPLKIRVKTMDWNFASVLSLIGASQLQEEYESQLSSDIDLVSDIGDWTNLSGQISIKNFYLKRGASFLRNPEPIEMKFNQGLISLQRFNLFGPNTDIQIKGNGFSFKDLNISVSAKSDLRLLQILVPFLEDLGGPFQMQTTFSGNIKRPEILGNASLQNAFVKLKGFPHPIEKLKADVLFSHSKVMIQNIKGFMANGTVSGEGTVTINGLKDIPTQIRIRAESISLNVPDKIKSQGSADLTFSGKWFPFILGGVYRINSALIEKEFINDENAKAQIRDSIYLPKLLKESTFDPVLLDLQLNLERNVLVKNSQMEGLITGQVQVKGPPTNPILLGRINLEKNSKLMFKSNIFEVQNGNATFNNPNKIQAELYISAQSRVVDYDVNLLVQGQSSNPQIKLSSIPPLPDQEIISLLALGVTSEKLEQSQSRDQATRVGYEAGAVFLNQIGVNKGLRSTLGVNFELSSAFDNTKNANVPRVTFRKKLSRKWSTSYSQGVEAGQGPKEVKLQYQINNNLSGVGSWESRESHEGTSVRSGTKDQSIFGMDLEFKREFK